MSTKGEQPTILRLSWVIPHHSKYKYDEWMELILDCQVKVELLQRGKK
jgi:hypothetical protein